MSGYPFLFYTLSLQCFLLSLGSSSSGFLWVSEMMYYYIYSVILGSNDLDEIPQLHRGAFVWDYWWVRKWTSPYRRFWYYSNQSPLLPSVGYDQRECMRFSPPPSITFFLYWICGLVGDTLLLSGISPLSTTTSLWFRRRVTDGTEGLSSFLRGLEPLRFPMSFLIGFIL